MSYHLLNDYDMSLKILEEFRKTQQVEKQKQKLPARSCVPYLSTVAVNECMFVGEAYTGLQDTLVPVLMVAVLA